MNCLTSKRKNQQGFTLLELAIVMVTAGFLMMGALALYRVYLVQKNIDLTYEKIDTLKASISIFSDSTGRYPCPSDPSLPYTDPMFGVENCAAAAALAEGTCTGPGNTGICRVPGRVIDVSGVAEAVYIGAVPFRTIKSGVEKVECINPATRAPTDCSAPGAVELVTNDASFQLSSLDSALDPWGYQVTYAVTASLTSAVSFNNGRGAISVRTEHGDSLVDPDGIVHYVLVSHGDNHNGVYNIYGKIINPCDTTMLEGENCDGDAVFVSGLRSLNEGPHYNDDVVYHRVNSLTELWGTPPADESGNVSSMHNLNDGNVGVGTNTPITSLDVAGSVRGESLKLDEICNRMGTECWSPELISGTGMSCPPPEPGIVYLARSITEGALDCVPVPIVQPLPGQSCASPDGFVVGFDTNGVIICEDVTPP